MSTSVANTKRRPANEGRPISYRLYDLLLRAYPAKFRCEYGPQMAQVFRDCHRAEERRGGLAGIAGLWLRTMLDLAQTAPHEHIENLGKEDTIMKNLKSDLVALLGCIGIIVVALVLLTYGRNHEVSSILMFGYALDALVSAGVIGNLIVFLLVKTTRLNPLRIALWTFLVVSAVFIFLTLIVGRTDPGFSLGNVLIGYVVSFLFWVGVHWLWSQTRRQPQALA